MTQHIESDPQARKPGEYLLQELKWVHSARLVQALNDLSTDLLEHLAFEEEAILRLECTR